jgi:hypothetical protein
MNEEAPIVPVEPNPFWKENAKKIVSESIASTEEAARQLIAVNSLLEAIYFHAVTFSDVKFKLNGEINIAIIYLAPVTMWLFSLVFAVLAQIPRIYQININSSSDSKERFIEIVSRKHRMLKTSEVFLIASFLVLFVALMHYLLAI